MLEDLRAIKTLDEMLSRAIERAKEALKTQTLHENCVTLPKEDVRLMLMGLTSLAASKKLERSEFKAVGLPSREVMLMLEASHVAPKIIIIDSLTDIISPEDDRRNVREECFLEFKKILEEDSLKIEMIKEQGDEKNFRSKSPFHDNSGKHLKKNNFYKGRKVK